MPPLTLIKIELTETEVESFKKFQKYRELFSILDQSGVFEIGYGKAVINIAGNIVQNVVVEEVKWKR